MSDAASRTRPRSLDGAHEGFSRFSGSVHLRSGAAVTAPCFSMLTPLSTSCNPTTLGRLRRCPWGRLPGFGMVGLASASTHAVMTLTEAWGHDMAHGEVEKLGGGERGNGDLTPRRVHTNQGVGHSRNAASSPSSQHSNFFAVKTVGHCCLLIPPFLLQPPVESPRHKASNTLSQSPTWVSSTALAWPASQPSGM
jgi:hypothetical protein